MDLRLTEEQQLLQQMVRDFAIERLRPGAAESDRQGRFRVDIYREMARLGLMGINVAADYGGAEMGPVALSLAITEIARECAATAVTVSVTNMVAEILQRFGTDAQKSTFIPRITSGQAIAGAFALSEANCGSDATALRTTAQRRADRYILNGEKMWITSGAHAGVQVVMAKTDKSAGARGISAFILTPDLPGFKVGREEEKLGVRASNTVSIILEDCEVPADRLLAEEGMGFKIAMTALDGGRIGVASQSLGIGLAARDAAARYALERRAFGQPIAEFDAIRTYIADMSTQLEAARLLTLRAAALKERGQARFTRESAMAKLFASEVANRVCGLAIQIHGGAGYTRDYPVERYFRDARVTTVYEGTSEIQKIVIAREILREFSGK